MRSRFWSFVEACDEARSARAVRDLLSSALRSIDVVSFALLTHAPPEDLRSLSVLAHNWSEEAIEHLRSWAHEHEANPIFERVEAVDETLYWASERWRSQLRDDQRLWHDELCRRVRGVGLTRSIKSITAFASCSIGADEPLQPEIVRTAVRIATYAFHQIQFLQRPQVRDSEQLTAREHECLYRATVFGERPSLVARRLGVKVSTVRTLRQKAYNRLDSDSPEQAVWRLIETGQLFGRGRRGRSRS